MNKYVITSRVSFAFSRTQTSRQVTSTATLKPSKKTENKATLSSKNNHITFPFKKKKKLRLRNRKTHLRIEKKLGFASSH